MSEQEERAIRLSEILVQRGLISEAQIELAMADREINDLPLEEVLLARGWVREDVLYEAAPWLKTKPQPKTAAAAKPMAAAVTRPTSSTDNSRDHKAAEKPPPPKVDIKAPPAGPAGGQQIESPLAGNYDDNLKAYRDLVKKITGRDFHD